jgi:hypothetical protein
VIDLAADAPCILTLTVTLNYMQFNSSPDVIMEETPQFIEQGNYTAVIAKGTLYNYFPSKVAHKTQGAQPEG